ncbi:hypothetical protein V6N11_022033 [Hibiscus sabdariffa]|uniref:Uncharacterized protein n=1 Tax=Hibiscus sabdariffa TaxID=183260 RepID=A0ABR2THY6_9ROSI
MFRQCKYNGLNLVLKHNSTPQATTNVENSLECSSDSSSGLVEPTASIKDTHINCHEEDEVAKAVCRERDPLIEVLSPNKEGRILGEKELAGITNFAELSNILIWVEFPLCGIATSTSRKQKRYGSIAEIQGKYLTSGEKKKRDRALNKLKKQGLLIDASDIEGRSLTEFDLIAHQEIWSRDARKTLELGKSVCIQILGSEEEVFHEIASLDVESKEER